MLHGWASPTAVVATCIIMPFLAGVAVILRIYARFFCTKNAGWDDYSTMVSMVRGSLLPTTNAFVTAAIGHAHREGGETGSIDATMGVRLTCNPLGAIALFNSDDCYDYCASGDWIGEACQGT